MLDDSLDITGHRTIEINQLRIAVSNDATNGTHSEEQRSPTKEWLYEAAIIFRHFWEDFAQKLSLTTSPFKQRARDEILRYFESV